MNYTHGREISSECDSALFALSSQKRRVNKSFPCSLSLEKSIRFQFSGISNMQRMLELENAHWQHTKQVSELEIKSRSISQATINEIDLCILNEGAHIRSFFHLDLNILERTFWVPKHFSRFRFHFEMLCVFFPSPFSRCLSVSSVERLEKALTANLFDPQLSWIC